MEEFPVRNQGHADANFSRCRRATRFYFTENIPGKKDGKLVIGAQNT